MEKAFEIAREMRYTAVFLCGDPEVYHKIGFRPSYVYDIYHIEDKDRNAEYCMVRELVPDALTGISGFVDIV